MARQGTLFAKDRSHTHDLVHGIPMPAPYLLGVLHVRGYPQGITLLTAMGICFMTLRPEKSGLAQKAA